MDSMNNKNIKYLIISSIKENQGIVVVTTIGWSRVQGNTAVEIFPDHLNYFTIF